MGNAIATTRIMDPTNALSSVVFKASARGGPNQSSPLRRISMGATRLNPMLNNKLSLFGFWFAMGIAFR